MPSRVGGDEVAGLDADAEQLDRLLRRPSGPVLAGLARRGAEVEHGQAELGDLGTVADRAVEDDRRSTPRSSPPRPPPARRSALVSRWPPTASTTTSPGSHRGDRVVEREVVPGALPEPSAPARAARAAGHAGSSPSTTAHAVAAGRCETRKTSHAPPRTGSEPEDQVDRPRKAPVDRRARRHPRLPFARLDEAAVVAHRPLEPLAAREHEPVVALGAPEEPLDLGEQPRRPARGTQVAWNSQRARGSRRRPALAQRARARRAARASARARPARRPPRRRARPAPRGRAAPRRSPRSPRGSAG